MQTGSDKDFETKVQAYILFFEKIGARRAAEFCVNQDYTIYGLTQNNDAFRVEYRRAAQQLHESGTPLATVGEGKNANDAEGQK